MDSLLIAKIISPKSNGKKAIGTAYPISQNLVITARHVVDFKDRNTDELIHIIWKDINDNTGKPYTDKVPQTNIVFNGNDKYDLVLIYCKVPKQVRISPLLLSERPPVVHEKWESMGFPVIGKNNNGEWEKVSAMGEIFPLNTYNSLLELESKGDAKDKQGWQGFSGAPVFRGHTLIAVITDTPTELKERFRAVSIAYLIEHETKFRELTGINERQTDFNGAIDILQKNPLARSILFNKITSTDSNITDSPTQIISYLSRIAIPELINIIYEIQKDHIDKALRAVLACLLREILPSLYDPCCADKIRSAKQECSTHILEIPCSLEISAEMLMANVDNRPANIKLLPIDMTNPDRKQAYAGCYKLALPPESGAVTASQQIDNIHDDLYQRLGGGHHLDDIRIAIDEHLFKRIPPKQLNKKYKHDQKKRLVQSALKLDAKYQKPSYYWLWDIFNELDDKAHQDNFELLGKEIKVAYPEITLLKRDTSNDERELQETELFYLLKDTLDEE